ncbi:MAG TPA: M15 family metallopeptidase [Acidimicrobiales bacterium]|nr:M15 family metallopeptidase [Acidimicrobiales bacterium]
MGLRRRDNPIHTLAGVCLVVLFAFAFGLPAAAQTETSDALAEAQAERDAVRDQQDRIAERIDVLGATDAQIAAALDELDAALAAQEAVLKETLAAADAAAAAQREAEAELRTAERDVAILEQAIVEMAVASYVHPPTADLVQSLQAQSLSDAVIQQIYLDARAQRDVDLLDLLEEAEERAEARAAEVAAAVVAANEAVEAADAELIRLDDERQQQARFAADLQGRIDGALAEAAALADLDADLSAQIVAEQAALIARLPPPPPPEPEVVAAPAPTTPSTAPPTTVAPPTTAAPTPGSPAPTPAPTTTRPPTTTTRPPVTSAPRPSTPTPPLATVWGFTVHAGIADDVDAMLTAARADGITFGGSAYRSTDRQIELRIQNCGPTDYDIWYRPASTCSPPTAVPGRSLHEQGRALDLTFEGRLITSRANQGFQWLAANAASYGLFNLPSEPWHWSTTGG